MLADFDHRTWCHLLLLIKLRGQFRWFRQQVLVRVLGLFDRSLGDLATFAPDFHPGVVDTLFGLIFVAIPDTEATFSVVVWVHLTILTALSIPLALLRVPHRVVIGYDLWTVIRLLQFIVYLHLLNLALLIWLLVRVHNRYANRLAGI